MKYILVLLSIFLSINVFAQTKKQQQPTAPKPFVLGEIQELTSTVLGEKRTLNIYLPEGYNQNDTAKYPVVYLLDGGKDEDFIHVVGLFQFNTFEWINRVPKSIIVGIASTDRRRDFTFPTTIEEDRKKYPTTGHSDKFMTFLETELQPFINKKYKTTNDKTVIGESLGGLFGAEVLLKKPTLFNRYVIVSPSIWWDDGSLLSLNFEPLKNKLSQKLDVYIGTGKEGLAIGKHVMEIDANILADKLQSLKNKNLKVIFDYLPQEDHATVMYPALFNAMRALYPKQAETN